MKLQVGWLCVVVCRCRCRCCVWLWLWLWLLCLCVRCGVWGDTLQNPRVNIHGCGAGTHGDVSNVHTKTCPRKVVTCPRRDETRRNAYSRCPGRGHNGSLHNTTPCAPCTPHPVTNSACLTASVTQILHLLTTTPTSPSRPRSRRRAFPWQAKSPP